MVGVPGKSKGCVTCRRRKIKARVLRIYSASLLLNTNPLQCDEGKPFCNNCTRSNRTCEGYHREKKFVTHQGARAITHAHEASDSSTPSAPDPDQVLDIPPAIASQQNTILSDPFRDNEAFDTYFFNRFMEAVGSSGDGTRRHVHNWLQVTYQLSNRSTARLALRALCVARIGRFNEIASLQRLGHLIYGQALNALNHDLDSDDTAYTMQSALACRLLGCYEVTDPPTRSKGIDENNT